MSAIIKDLIGKPFRYGGRDESGFDCYGLAKLIYTRLDRSLPEQVYSDSPDVAEIAAHVEDLRDGFKKLDHPEAWCIALFKIKGPAATHVGVVLPVLHSFVHVMEHATVRIERLNAPEWKDRIEGFYRYEDITVGFCKNPLAPALSREITHMEDGRILSDILDYYKLDGKDWIVTVNSVHVPADAWSITPVKPGDFVQIIPVIQGGDSNSIVRLAMMIALSAALGPAGFGLGLGWVMAGTVAGALLINALLPPDKPSSTDSVANSWNPVTTQQEGTCIPILFGKHKLTGNIISAFIDVADDGTVYTNCLISLGIGPYLKITDIQLSGQDYALRENTTCAVALGYLDQSDAMDNIRSVIGDATKTQTSVNVEVFQTAQEFFTTTGSTFDDLEALISFPYGLWWQRDEGSLGQFGIVLQVDVSPKDLNDWKSITPSAIGSYEGENESLVSTTFGGWACVREVGIAADGVTPLYEVLEEGDGTGHTEGEEKAVLAIIYKWMFQPTIAVAASIYDYTTVSGESQTAILKTFGTKGKVAIEGGVQYDIRVTRLTYDITDSSYGATMMFALVNEVVYDEFNYPRQVLVGIRTPASYGSIDFSCIAYGRLVRIYNGSTWETGFSDNPAWVMTDVLMSPVFNDDGSVARYDGVNVSKIMADKFLELAEYSDGLLAQSGGGYCLPYVYGDPVSAFVVDEKITGATSGATGVIEYGSVTPDGDLYLQLKAISGTFDPDGEVITGDNVGTGTSTGSLLERRFTFNGVFDSQSDRWNAALSVGGVCRSVPYRYGDTISVVIDKPSTPTNLYTVGDIEKDSASVQYLSTAARATELEVDYNDEAVDYERTVSCAVSAISTSGTNKATITLFGVTRATEAMRLANYRLACNRYLIRTLPWSTSINSLADMIGDVVNVQLDMPAWGEGGRLVSATSNTVTLDRAITIEAGPTYRIMVKLSSDTLVEKTITNAAGTYTVLTLASPFSTVPSPFDVYSVGIVGKVVKPFRITRIERDGDNNAKLQGIEYVEAVYDSESTAVIPQRTYTRISAAPIVTNLTVTEQSVISQNGTLDQSLKVTWIPPSDQSIKFYNVLYREFPYTVWNVAGTTTETTFTIRNIHMAAKYQVMVVCVNMAGVPTPRPKSAMTGIETSNNGYHRSSQLKATVNGLAIEGQGNDGTFTGRDCVIKWSKTSSVDRTFAAGEEPPYESPDLWFRDYEVKIINMNGTLRRVEYVTNPFYTYTEAKNRADGSGTPSRSFTVEVRARDRFYQASERPGTLTVTPPTIPAPANPAATAWTKEIIVTFDLVPDADVCGYEIHESLSASFTPSASTLFLKTPINRVIREIATGTTIYFKVRAYDWAGNFSGYSAEVSATAL